MSACRFEKVSSSKRNISFKWKKRGILLVEQEFIGLFAEIIKKKYKAYEIYVRIEQIIIPEIFKEGINLDIKRREMGN